MKLTSRRLLAGAALASVLLAGCDAGEVLDSEDSAADPTVTEPSDVEELESALSIGDTFDTFDGEASTTVDAIVRGGGESWLPAGANFEWLSASVRTCVSAGGSSTEVGWYQWAATGTDDGWYPADLDYDGDRPLGQYPRLADLAPGDCAEGRILIAIPRDVEVVTLINADQAGRPQGSWLIGDADVPAATDGE